MKLPILIIAFSLFSISCYSQIDVFSIINDSGNCDGKINLELFQS